MTIDFFSEDRKSTRYRENQCSKNLGQRQGYSPKNQTEI